MTKKSGLIIVGGLVAALAATPRLLLAAQEPPAEEREIEIIATPLKLGVHGAAKHSDATRELFIPAGAAFGNGVLSSLTPLTVWELIDGATKIIDGFNFKVPDDFVSFVKVELVWLSPAASGNMNWQMRAWYGAAGETYTTHSDGPAAGTTATGGSNVFNVQESPNALTLADLARGDLVGIRVDRYGADASDTLGASCYVAGLLFTYTAEQ